MKNVLPSSARLSAVGRYLVAISDSIVRSSDEDNGLPEKKRPPPQRKQLHILYLVHDSLHHARHHARDPQAYGSVSVKLKECIQGLVRATSALDAGPYSRHLRKLHDLIQLWEEADYFDASCIQELRDAGKGGHEVEKGGKEGMQEIASLSEDRKSHPYLMPASHGDASTPFYDLPAGNMMPHIIPNSTNPINPQLVRPLQFAAGPAEQDLASSVKAFLDDVDSLDHLSFEGIGEMVDVDELGQSIVRDKLTKEIVRAEGYYGWSRNFCEKMKRGEDIAGLSKDISDDSGDEVVWNSRKRRRPNYSQSGSSRSRSRSLSSSRSQRYSRERYRSLRSRSPSRSPSRSYSPPSPPPNVVGPPASSQALPTSIPGRSPPRDPRRPPLLSRHGPAPPSALSNPGPNPTSLGAAIPPRPPNYDGLWPPPPPPSTGPRAPQAFYPSISPYNQPSSATATGQANWSQQQQQQSNQDASSAYGTPPLAQGLYNGVGQNVRGWGNARGGFGR